MRTSPNLDSTNGAICVGGHDILDTTQCSKHNFVGSGHPKHMKKHETCTHATHGCVHLFIQYVFDHAYSAISERCDAGEKTLQRQQCQELMNARPETIYLWTLLPWTESSGSLDLNLLHAGIVRKLQLYCHRAPHKTTTPYCRQTNTLQWSGEYPIWIVPVGLMWMKTRPNLIMKHSKYYNSCWWL